MNGHEHSSGSYLHFALQQQTAVETSSMTNNYSNSTEFLPSTAASFLLSLFSFPRLPLIGDSLKENCGITAILAPDFLAVNSFRNLRASRLLTFITETPPGPGPGPDLSK
ncbi:hypothetical protein Mapa_009358 [Marchantia paleacea]|nr:hypothetical protein Mapa_009358 [Marchantia paleacea]